MLPFGKRICESSSKSTTVFIVEAQEDGNDRVVIGGVMETTFENKNVTPGVQIAYRVKATRDKLESEYRTRAVAYFKGLKSLTNYEFFY